MASVPDSSLQIGLAALRSGNYSAAIAHLEAVCQTQMNQSSRLRAQIGLVAAYEGSGKIAEAIALCQLLSQSTNPQVREWVTRTITTFKNRYSTDSSAQDASAQNNTDVAFDRPAQLNRPEGSRTEDDRQGNKARGQEEVPIIPSYFKLPTPKISVEWRQAGRAKRWQPIHAVNLIPFWLLQVGCVSVLFWLLSELLEGAMLLTNNLLVKLPYLEPFQPFYRDPTLFVLWMLVILTLLSPWLLSGLLRFFYGLQPLSINTLSTYSLEANRVLQRYCRQQRLPLPRLSILLTSAPIALTYGNLPWTAHIVVSQGLLEQLASDEIATIYAAQLGHIAHWDFVVMSLFILITQLPYVIYRQVSEWGDRTNSILRLVAVVIATCAYGLWYLLTIPALWLSQLRIYYSDRKAVELTGNPNGLTRALLKIAQGIVQDIQQQGHTSWVIESLDLATSVGYRQAISLGSLHSYTQIERVLAWDCLNPYRHWLIINNSHPLMGDRLQRLAAIAQQWHLEPELNLNAQAIANQNLKSFLLQVAPFFGIPSGFALGGITWLLGGVGILLGIAQLAWMYGDWLLIKGLLPIGFSIGTFLRMNSFFPDIKPSTVQPDPSLIYLLANPTALPIDSQPIHLQGKLLGRRGIGNFLGQDLLLQSPTGLIKLHHVSWLGPVGNLLLSQASSPRGLVEQYIVATGWFRRGATSWIDIDTLRTQSGKTSYSAHPVWSTLLASAAAIWGAYVILGG